MKFENKKEIRDYSKFWTEQLLDWSSTNWHGDGSGISQLREGFGLIENLVLHILSLTELLDIQVYMSSKQVGKIILEFKEEVHAGNNTFDFCQIIVEIMELEKTLESPWMRVLDIGLKSQSLPKHVSSSQGGPT